MVKQTEEGVEVSREEDMIENNDKQEKTVVRLYFAGVTMLPSALLSPPPLLERPRTAPVLVSPLL